MLLVGIGGTVSRTRVIFQEKAPLLLTALLALISWFGQQYLDRLLDAPVLSYQIEIVLADPPGIPSKCAEKVGKGALPIAYRMVVENLSRKVSFRELDVSFDVPTRLAEKDSLGGVYAVRAIDIAPARSEVRGSPRCAEDAPGVVTLSIPVLQPGMKLQFDVWASVGSEVEPYFDLRNDAALIMSDRWPDLRPFFLRHQGKLLFGVFAFLAALAGWYLYVLGRDGDRNA